MFRMYQAAFGVLISAVFPESGPQPNVSSPNEASSLPSPATQKKYYDRRVSLFHPYESSFYPSQKQSIILSEKKRAKYKPHLSSGNRYRENKQLKM